MCVCVCACVSVCALGRVLLYMEQLVPLSIYIINICPFYYFECPLSYST